MMFVEHTLQVLQSSTWLAWILARRVGLSPGTGMYIILTVVPLHFEEQR